VEYLGNVPMIWNCYHYITFVFDFCSVSTLYYFCQKRKRIVPLLNLTYKTIFMLLILAFIHDCSPYMCSSLIMVNTQINAWMSWQIYLRKLLLITIRYFTRAVYIQAR
jgi:hypothetical protein